MHILRNACSFSPGIHALKETHDVCSKPCRTQHLLYHSTLVQRTTLPPTNPTSVRTRILTHTHPCTRSYTMLDVFSNVIDWQATTTRITHTHTHTHTHTRISAAVIPFSGVKSQCPPRAFGLKCAGTGSYQVYIRVENVSTIFFLS
jgi:hypothetical protein